MSDKFYINTEGSLSPVVRQLTTERTQQLINHFRSCEVALSSCALCHELYEGIGHENYVNLLTEGMEE